MFGISSWVFSCFESGDIAFFETQMITWTMNCMKRGVKNPHLKSQSQFGVNWPLEVAAQLFPKITWSMTHVILCLCSHYPYSVFVPITLSVFSPNAEKYRPEITPYLDNFHAEYIVISRCILYHYWIRIQQQHHMEL